MKWLAVLGALLLVGCSAKPDSLGERGWEEELTRLRSEASEQTLQILEDGQVSDAEWAETQASFISCMATYNLKVTFEPSGDFDASGDVTEEEYDAASAACKAASGLDEVEYLYFNMRENPENVDPTQLTLKCLKEKGLVPDGFTAEDYERAFEESLQDEEGRKILRPARGFTFEDTDENTKAFMECL